MKQSMTEIFWHQFLVFLTSFQKDIRSHSDITYDHQLLQAIYDPFVKLIYSQSSTYFRNMYKSLQHHQVQEVFLFMSSDDKYIGKIIYFKYKTKVLESKLLEII